MFFKTIVLKSEVNACLLCFQKAKAALACLTYNNEERLNEV